MTYDPNRTTVLPQAPAGFPITEELPAVQSGRQRNWGRSFGLVLLVIAIAVALVFAANEIRDQRSTTTADTAVAVVPTADVEQAPAQPAPTVAVTNSDPGYWQVVGVADGLNVRSGPGTTNDVVGILAAGQRHVFATGQRSSSDGEWMQISLGDADQVGWVSARFLTPDVEPAEGEPQATVVPVTGNNTSVVCFASSTDPVRVARIEFTNRVQIAGEILTTTAEAQIRQRVSGTLENGEAVITLIESAADAVSRQRWTFNPATIDLGDGAVLNVVDCSAIDLN